jgi:hypothetical protein
MRSGEDGWLISVEWMSLKLMMNRIDGLLLQSESIDSGSKDGIQMVVVSLLAAVFGLSIEAGCKRMNQPRLEPGFPKGSPRRLVIRDRHFYCYDDVFQIMLLHGLLQREHGRLKCISIVFDTRRLGHHVSVEVHQHPFQSGPGTINRDNARFLRANGLDSWLKDALGATGDSLSECLRSTSFSPCAVFTLRNHFRGLRE